MFRALPFLVLLSYLALANAAPDAADLTPARLKLGSVRFYDLDNGVDCVAEYTFMPEGTFSSCSQKKANIIKKLNLAFDARKNWCRYMGTPIAYPGCAKSSCFPNKVAGECYVERPRSGHKVQVYDRMGLFTWGFLRALYFGERPNQPKSLSGLCAKKIDPERLERLCEDRGLILSIENDLLKGLRNFLISMGIDPDKSDFFSLPVFGVNAGFKSVFFRASEIDFGNEPMVRIDQRSRDRLCEIFKGPLLNNDYIFDNESVHQRDYRNNPFCSEPLVEKTMLEWPGGSSVELPHDRGPGTLSILEFEPHGLEGGRFKIEWYNMQDKKIYNHYFVCDCSSEALTCGLKVIDATVCFSGDDPTSSNELFFTVKDATAQRFGFVMTSFLERLFRSVDAKLRKDGTSLWEKIVNRSPQPCMNAKAKYKNEYSSQNKNTVRRDRGTKLNLACFGFGFKHKSAPCVDLTKFFVDQNLEENKSVGFFLDQVELSNCEESTTGSARLVYINGATVQTFGLVANKTKGKIEFCDFTHGKVPFLTLLMNKNKILSLQPFSPMFGIESGGDQVVRYLDHGALLPQKPISTKRLWAAHQHAQYMGREVGMGFANVALNLLCLPFCVLKVFSDCLEECDDDPY
jgi:hypothetical protein